MSDHCPACGHDVLGFQPGLRDRPRAECPKCQALERHRLFAIVLADHAPAIRDARTILDVAPHGQTRRIVRRMTDGTYIGMDVENRPGPTVLGSLTDMPFATGSLDVVICMHVLEHVPDDGAAIREISRVLHREGIAFIQVPRRSDARTDEDPSATEGERIRRFGQADHVRLYGSDFEHRLYRGGLSPTAVWPSMFLDDADVHRFGLQPNEHLWICRTRRESEDHLMTRSEAEARLQREIGIRRRIELDPPVRIVRGIQRRLRSLRRR